MNALVKIYTNVGILTGVYVAYRNFRSLPTYETFNGSVGSVDVISIISKSIIYGGMWPILTAENMYNLYMGRYVNPRLYYRGEENEIYAKYIMHEINE